MVVCWCIVAKSCKRCNSLQPMDSSPPGSSVHGIFQARILEWVVIFFLQGFFLTLGSNLNLLYLLHCWRILYPLSHQRSQIRF